MAGLMTTPIWRKQFWLGMAGIALIGATWLYLLVHPTSKLHQQSSDLCDCTLKKEVECSCHSRKPDKFQALVVDPSRTHQVATEEVVNPSRTHQVATEEAARLAKLPKIPNLGVCDACLAGKRLVTVNRGWICGQARIGNKMFMMASVIAAAARWNVTFVLPQGDKSCDWIDMLKDIFISVSTNVPLLPESMMKDWPAVGEPGFTKFAELQPKSQNVSIAGYRQSWKYFSDNLSAHALRETFKFNSKYETAAKNSVNDAKSKFSTTNPIFVGVHMRIGDLREKLRLDYGYRMANQSFYINALEAVNNHFNQSKSLIFLVASDTLGEAKKMLSSIEKLYNIYWLHGSAFEDFAALSKCNHSIISGGTYGFWAAWLAGGETFYFSNFSKPGTTFDKGFISKNFYLPRWKPVGWTKYIPE